MSSENPNDNIDEVVDKEVQAHITNLVSALGGVDITKENEPYVLGDDALSCLRDLKKWLRVVDEKRQILDVARAISQTSLVTYDLLEILSQWDEKEEKREHSGEEGEDVKGFKIALACLELLVPLTWPIVLDVNSTHSQFFHAPALKLAYIRYKQAILTHKKNRVFRAIIRLCIPALQSEYETRSSRDEGILKLAMYFFRNIFCINLKDDQKYSEDIARSAEIGVLARQEVLDFIVTIASGTGSLFKVQSVATLECLYYLIYGIEVHQVLDIKSDFTPTSMSKPTQDLMDLLVTEKKIKKTIQKTASSRHNRFGTMVSVTTPDHDRLTVSGQSTLLDTSTTLHNLDAVKSWKKPKRTDIKNRQQWDIYVKLSEESRQLLKPFIENFLVSGFNPLFIEIRKTLEREMGEYSRTLLTEHEIQFLYLSSWFLKADRARYVIEGGSNELDFSNTACALNQNMFIIIMHSMRVSFEAKEWHVVYASMLCFKEVLYTVQDMESQGTEEMKDMADNIKSRLFYEEYSLELLAKIPKYAALRDTSYINLAVELTHIVLKTLEKYASENTVYIKAKRQQKTKKQRDNIDTEVDSEEEDMRDSRKLKERKFNFKRFETKFMSEETLDTYIKYLTNYHELSRLQIMYAIKFFHRIFVRCKHHYFFYRLDFMKLLHEMVEPKVSTSIDRATRKDITNFLNYFIHRLIPALEATPSLFVEILFQKMPSDLFYFENGYDKPPPVPKASKVPTLVFVDHEFLKKKENKFAVLVAALLDEDRIKYVEWVVEALENAYKKRASWIELSAATNDSNTSVIIPDESMCFVLI